MKRIGQARRRSDASRSGNRCCAGLHWLCGDCYHRQPASRINWGAEGPRAGFFPFYIALLHSARQHREPFLRLYRYRRAKSCSPNGANCCRVLSVIIPTAVYVGIIPTLGIYVSSALLIALFMKWLGKYRWSIVALIALGVPVASFWFSKSGSWCRCRRGRWRRCWGFDREQGSRDTRHGDESSAGHGRNRQSVSRLCGRAAAVQHHGDGDRDSARRHHRCAARPRRRQRRGNPVAADLLDVANLGDHHAFLHLLGRAVRRRHHLDIVQHSGRALVGRDHLRRLSHGAEGSGGRGAYRGLHLLLRWRACSPSS